MGWRETIISVLVVGVPNGHSHPDHPIWIQIFLLLISCTLSLSFLDHPPWSNGSNRVSMKQREWCWWSVFVAMALDGVRVAFLPIVCNLFAGRFVHIYAFLVGVIIFICVICVCLVSLSEHDSLQELFARFGRARTAQGTLYVIANRMLSSHNRFARTLLRGHLSDKGCAIFNF